MNRNLIYTLSLAGFFLVWGVFGFAAASPQAEGNFPATVPSVEATQLIPASTDSAGIPITGEAEPVLTEVFVFYGLIGGTAIFLILALLNIANRSTPQHVEHKTPPSDGIQSN
jgi:hypothetical protein